MQTVLGETEEASADPVGSDAGGVRRSPAPLRLSGVVVARDALLEALRNYLPDLTGLEQLDDDRFVLTLSSAV